MTEKPRKKLEDDIRAWQLYLKDELPWKLDDKIPVPYEKLYFGWHNGRYLQQCYYNLEEKYDRGGISDDEWSKILRCHALSEMLLPFPMNPPVNPSLKDWKEVVDRVWEVRDGSTDN